jgi:hypothetical protein
MFGLSCEIGARRCYLLRPPPPAESPCEPDFRGRPPLERVKELAAAYAGAAEPPPPIVACGTCRGRHSLAARAARAVSDAAAGIGSVLIVAEAERAEAERLVGAHRASVNDKDPLALVLVAGKLAQPVVVASGTEAGEFFATYGRVRRGR